MPAKASPYEQFEQYLAGEMPPEERQLFEARLNSDPQLAETFRAYKQLNEEYSEMEQLREEEAALSGTLAQMNRKYFSAGETMVQKKQAPVRRMVFAVAAAASLIAAFFLLKPMWFAGGNKNLFNEYYENEQMSVERGAMDSAAQAAALYNAKDYAKTLTILEPFTKAHPEKTELQVFTGRCYLETAAYDKADSVFSAIAKGGTVFSDKAQWLQALVMLKQKQNEAAKQLLEKIPGNSAYYKQAKELMGKL